MSFTYWKERVTTLEPRVLVGECWCYLRSEDKDPGLFTRQIHTCYHICSFMDLKPYRWQNLWEQQVLINFDSQTTFFSESVFRKVIWDPCIWVELWTILWNWTLLHFQDASKWKIKCKDKLNILDTYENYYLFSDSMSQYVWKNKTKKKNPEM